MSDPIAGLMSRNFNTLGAHVDEGSSITAYCLNEKCRHSARLDLVALADRFGRDHGAMHWDLAPKLVCTSCGGKRIAIRLGNPEERFGR